MSITNYLNKIKTAVYGRDVRGAIHDAIKECYDDASANHDNANMEVKMARGTHNTLNDRLDNVDEIQAQTNAQLSSIYVNPLYPPHPLLPLNADGITDDSQRLQLIIDYCKNNKKYLLLPDADILIEQEIIIPQNMRIEGTSSSVWGSAKGTRILTNMRNGVLLSIAERSVILNNFSIESLNVLSDSDNLIGIQVTNSGYDFSFKNIKIKKCTIGFDILDSWTYMMDKCRTEGCDTGFKLSRGTSATLNSCVAFNSKNYGFHTISLTYTSFISCGADGCNVGLFMENTARGVTFSSFGVEHSGETCIKSNGQNISATFTGLNIGNHSDTNVNIVDVTASNLTFTDFRLTTTFSPISPGKILSIDDTANVTLINATLFGSVGDIDKCNVIGGNLENNLTNNTKIKSVTSNLFNSYSGTTPELQPSNGLTDELFKIGLNETYLVSTYVYASGTQQCNQILSTSNNYANTTIFDLTKNAVGFVIENNGSVKILNTSSNSRVYKWSAIRIR